MANYGYDVISVATANTTAAASVVHDLDFVSGVVGVGANDTPQLDELDFDKLLTYVCSHYHQSAVESLTGNVSSSFSNPIHFEDHADRKQQTSDHFRFVIDVYVMATICVIGFMGKSVKYCC